MCHGFSRVRGVLGGHMTLGLKIARCCPYRYTLTSQSSQQPVEIANIAFVLGFQVFFHTYSVGINLAMAFLVAHYVCLSPVFSGLAVVGGDN